MNPTREEALFGAALERSAEKRPDFLDGACLGDSALRERVEALLASHDATANPQRTAATMTLERAELPDEAVGQTLGRYKLLERVGEGGCGVVYVAEQKEPVRPSTKLTQALVAAEVTRWTSGGAEESASSRLKIRRERCLESVD